MSPEGGIHRLCRILSVIIRGQCEGFKMERETYLWRQSSFGELDYLKSAEL